MSKRICPQEDIGFHHVTGQMYHKLRSGCGWTGETDECEVTSVGPYVDFRCPNCWHHTEDLQTHVAKMRDKPSGWVSEIPMGLGFISGDPGFTFCPHCGERL